MHNINHISTYQQSEKKIEKENKKLTEHKTQIINLLRATERAGIENLLEWMEANGFYDAPASSKYHLAEPGGLAEHSLNVLDTAITMFNALYAKDRFEWNERINSIVICSLLHDLGKAGQFGKQNYIKNMDPEQFGAYKTNKDLVYIPHEVRSIAIASKFIELTEEEQFAILYHNGLYGELHSLKYKETPLYMILHFADMWASRVIEEKEGEQWH